MTIVVENGTALDTANSFASVAEADAFNASRGVTGWASLTTAAKEAALINASEFLSDAFGYIGVRKTDTQALAWPRVPSVDKPNRVPANVPNRVKVATFRVASAVALDDATLFAAVAAGDALRKVKAGSVEVEFATQAAEIAATGRSSMPWLATILAGLIVTAPDNAGANGMHTLRVTRA